MYNLEEIKKVIKDNYKHGDCGIFDCRNVVGDTMINIYNKDNVSIDICYDWLILKCLVYQKMISKS